jgi:hypothetical protein
MKLIKTFGNYGKGPNEFIFPTLCRNIHPDILATAFEKTTGKGYDIWPDGSITPGNINTAKPPSTMPFGNQDDRALMTDSLLYYVENSPAGKSIFTINETGNIHEIQNLALNSKQKNPVAYTGNFAVNTDQTRMVYAYRFSKVIKFFDREHGTVRTLNFGKEEFDEKTSRQTDMMDYMVNHYVNIYTGENYVYLYYYGGIPAETKENISVIEKYDWNGQPIARYKLDQDGFFAIDEKNNHLYLVSYNHDDPFFRYQL